MDETLQHKLDTALRRLGGSEELKRMRREAMDSFRATGFPTRRDEDWRYTDLKPLASGDFDPLAPTPSPQAVESARAALALSIAAGASSSRLVFVDGHYVPTLSALAAREGMRVTAGESLEHALQDRPRSGSHPLATLNAALLQTGAWIRISEGVRVEAPLHMVFVATARAHARSLHPRVVVDLAPGAQAIVVQHFLDAEATTAWVNVVTQADLQPRSKLEIYRLQEHERTLSHTGLVQARVRQDARLLFGSVDLGGRLVRTDVDVTLAERGASAALFGLFLASERQHVDNHTVLDHVAPETRSEEIYNGIVGALGRGVFNGKVIVRPDAQRIDARQRTDNLVLGEQAEIDAKPELEIYADDVKCTHGATVGELDAEQLFYLRARGMDEQTARALLTFAFANRVLARMELPELRAAVQSKLARDLPQQERWLELQ